MAKQIQYTANTGIVTISTANSALDGTGSLGTILTAASQGTLVKKIFIKSQVSTTPGMIRIFVYGGSNKLIDEIFVPVLTRSLRDPSFEAVLPINYFLQSGAILKATTEVGNQPFNIIAEGLDWDYYGSIRPESTKYTANTGFATINSGNSNLDGTGNIGTDMWDVLTAASNGTVIQSITIKSQVSTTPGMIRLFIYNTSSNFLLTEIPVPYSTKSGTAHSFSHRIDFNGLDLALKSGYKLRATTQNSEAFNVIAEGLDWAYPA